jgi:hypothetical protein
MSLADYTHVEDLRYVGSGNATLTGDLRSNGITGNSATIFWTAGAGADTLNGLSGNETYYIDNLRQDHRSIRLRHGITPRSAIVCPTV